MTAEKAAGFELAAARNRFARKVRAAAEEMTAQANRVDGGFPYEGRKVRARLEAIDEAREIVIALNRLDAELRLSA